MRPTAIDVAIWLAAAGAIAATIWSSLAAPPDVDRLLGSDKVVHALAFAIDTFLLLLAVVWRPGRAQALAAWTLPILLGVATLGVAIELIQATVGRDADPADWIADLIGVAAATLVFTVLRRRLGTSSA
jgi:VanZ family protein